MGKGDKKTKRGKIFAGSFGKVRPKPNKLKKHKGPAEDKAEKEVKETKAAAKTKKKATTAKKVAKTTKKTTKKKEETAAEG